MIEVRNLSKRYGGAIAVDDLSFTVHPGRVTGFLGPNGAGKSTTMRIMLGLDRPTGGRALIDGEHFSRLPEPLRRVGALLETTAAHGGRRARDHLLWLARSNRIPDGRVAEVLRLTGLESVARKRVKGFSLGMSQRLGMAATLLADTTVAGFIAANTRSYVRIRTPEPERMRDALAGAGVTVRPAPDGALEAEGTEPGRIGELAAAHGLVLHEVTVREASLEEAFMRLTGDAVDHRAGGRR